MFAGTEYSIVVSATSVQSYDDAIQILREVPDVSSFLVFFSHHQNAAVPLIIELVATTVLIQEVNKYYSNKK